MREFFLLAGYYCLYFLLGIVLLALGLNLFHCVAKAEPMYAAGVPFEWRIVDGDTISTTARPRTYYRLAGYDAPEITRPRCDKELVAGAAAKRKLEALLKSDNLVWFNSGKLDRYNRPLVYIWINGSPVSTLMISSNLGVPSDGKRKPKWCSILK